MSHLPMSLRTAACEQRYQDDKAAGKITPLELIESVEVFDHWRIIENDYCYCVGYMRSHIILIKRAGCGSYFDLTPAEKLEFDNLKRDRFYNEYDQIIENSPRRRSVPNLFHYHLINFHGKREDMSL